jgi:hypothetical protein
MRSHRGAQPGEGAIPELNSEYAPFQRVWVGHMLDAGIGNQMWYIVLLIGLLAQPPRRFMDDLTLSTRPLHRGSGCHECRRRKLVRLQLLI